LINGVEISYWKLEIGNRKYLPAVAIEVVLIVLVCLFIILIWEI